MLGGPGVIKAPNDDYTITGKPAADLAKDLTKHWHPRVKPLFDNMDESDAAFWKITCSSPNGVPEWPNDPRVTLIGDAVHAMTPAGGNGANTAVRDSALLGRLLAEAGGYKESSRVTRRQARSLGPASTRTLPLYRTRNNVSSRHALAKIARLQTCRVCCIPRYQKSVSLGLH
jgi:2-polyprenyl-6-methoxyphenol hydroxylase-like FAD-dependent oxidoreductase